MIDYNGITFDAAKINSNSVELSFIFDREIDVNVFYKLNYFYGINSAEFIDNKIIIISSIATILDILTSFLNNTTSPYRVKKINNLMNELK